jgi:hypothetical protein
MGNEWKIIIAERGWIFAGRIGREGDYVVLHDAYNVRRFSLETKDGLGGLAMRAPTPRNDEMDALTKTRIHVLCVIADIDCNDEAWKAWHEARAAKEAKPKRGGK